MNPEDYVSYPLALALKKHGFDLEVNHVYDKNGVLREEGMNENADCDYTAYFNYNKSGYIEVSASAPTLAQAQKWLREKRYCCVTVYAQPYNGVPYYTGYILFKGDETKVLDQDGHWFDEYEEALLETIAAALELINKENK